MATSQTSSGVDYDPSGSPVTGRRVLFIILAFFGVIISVNVTMVIFAINNFGGLVVANSYVASQRFNQDIAAARAAPSVDWSFLAQGDPEGVTLTVTDVAGAPAALTGLRGVIGRPSHEREDVPVQFETVKPGVYRAAAALKQGSWRVSLAFDGPSGPIARRVDLFLPPSPSNR